mmetsp:Transcript_12943/g.19347  ORF Transcript_12943/g.19347 Transcript_12943/m.19347 type:complete len:185 (+) Transcript_12943:345-899(+)
MVPYDGEDWDNIKEFYGLSESFPRDNLYVHKVGSSVVFLVSNRARSLILDTEEAKRLKVVGSGVKVFEKNSKAKSACKYRVSFEGLSSIFTQLTKRVLEIGDADFLTAMRGGMIKLEEFSEEMQEDLKGEDMGNLILVLRRSLSKSNKVAFPIWKDKMINVLVKKEYLAALKYEAESIGNLSSE